MYVWNHCQASLGWLGPLQSWRCTSRQKFRNQVCQLNSVGYSRNMPWPSTASFTSCLCALGFAHTRAPFLTRVLRPAKQTRLFHGRPERVCSRFCICSGFKAVKWNKAHCVSFGRDRILPGMFLRHNRRTVKGGVRRVLDARQNGAYCQRPATRDSRHVGQGAGAEKPQVARLGTRCRSAGGIPARAGPKGGATIAGRTTDAVDAGQCRGQVERVREFGPVFCREESLMTQGLIK